MKWNEQGKREEGNIGEIMEGRQTLNDKVVVEYTMYVVIGPERQWSTSHWSTS